MTTNDQATQDKASRSFAQEMQQAIVEWVRKLPFLKRNVPDNHDVETPGEASTGGGSGPQPTEGVPLGTPPGNEGRPG